jgi:hypothetical protein
VTVLTVLHALRGGDSVRGARVGQPPGAARGSARPGPRFRAVREAAWGGGGASQGVEGLA